MRAKTRRLQPQNSESAMPNIDLAKIMMFFGEAKDKAMGAVKDQAAVAAKGMLGKFFGR